MLHVRWSLTASALLLAGQFAHANMDVSFIESAPKDRFVLQNTSQCAIKDVTVHLDLSSSLGHLIFDTTAAGAGVEVFQPFEVTRGSLQLISSNDVQDGDSTLSFTVENIDVNESASFTIDVDDTLTQSELGNIRVSGSEITGATIEILATNRPAVKATFDTKGKATLAINPC